MSLQHPVKKVFITQKWGVNQQSYAKFGLLGHNGTDYRAFLPNGERCYEGGKSEVFAPHDGTVIENLHDTNGYGWYLKIENDKEGSILAHFSHQSKLKVGQKVKQGDFVGYQGTTGNSTGIHLHWGYYPKPRDKSNGYSGTIDTEKLNVKSIGEQGGSVSDETMTVKKSDWNRLLDASKKGDNLINALGLSGAIADKSEAELNQLYTLKVDRDRYRDERNSAREEIKHLDYELNKISTEAKELAVELSKCQLQKDELAKQLESAKNTTGEIKIDREVKVAGQNWIINGVEVNSEGVVTANYAKK